MRFNSFRFGAVLVIVGLMSSAAMAAPKRLAALDSNQDGAVSVSEMLQLRAQRFSALDRNQNKLLEAEELANSARQQRATRRFSKLDSNQDQRVSPSEWDARVADVFARFDQNNDKFLNAEELREIGQRARQAKRCR